MNTTLPSPLTQHRGRLIIFEGIDGTGKSTQIQLLADYLRDERQVEVITSFEPTRGLWGMRVREAAQAHQRLGMEEEITCLLRDREEHINTLIRPALERGAWVLLDRYYPSMMAYQGASGADMDEIQRMNEQFAIIPDLALYLRISLEESRLRMEKRGLAKDAFEEDSFQARVSQLYDQMEMTWWRRIDGELSIDGVQELIRAQLADL